MERDLARVPQPPTDAPAAADGCVLSRRGFLGGLGGAAAAAAVGGAVLEPMLPGGSRAEASELGPLIGQDRLDAAYRIRIRQADRMVLHGMPVQTCNGDEDLYPNRIGSYSKALPHDAIGEVDPDAYQTLLDALATCHPDDFEAIPMGGVRKLTNPQAGIAFDTQGNDPHQFAQPPAPAFASAWEAGEMVELYWMAQLRDLPFTAYRSAHLTRVAADELSGLSDFRGPKIGGRVTPQTLFRDDLPGALDGPYLSQFLLKPAPFGAEFVDRRMRTVVPGRDHMTRFGEWRAVQNGNVPGRDQYDSVRRYVRNGRDLAEWVHVDVLFQAYFNACLILGTPPDRSNFPTGGGIGCPAGPGNPYLASATQDGFGTWGGPYFKTLTCEVARALKAVWFQKWFVHRRLRPEAFAGRVHVHHQRLADYPIHADVLGSEALHRIQHRTGTSLLPMAFPEGSPTHPAYGAGHATVAGACVTILKALFDESFEVPFPVVPNTDGADLVRYAGPPLTVGGELNKLASNVATGRNHAGVHWRSDAVESLKLGEELAIAILEDQIMTLDQGGSFQLTRFDGTPIVIS
jgi:hypothetical protein